MVIEALLELVMDLVAQFPVVTLPDGFMQSLNFFSNVIGTVNVFLPVVRLLPVFALIVMVRRFDMVVAVINWVIRLIPFVG